MLNGIVLKAQHITKADLRKERCCCNRQALCRRQLPSTLSWPPPGVFVNGSLLTPGKMGRRHGEDISADIQLAEVTADLGGDWLVSR